MYAALRTTKVNPDDMDKVIDKVDTEFLEMLNKMDGFVSYYLVQTHQNQVTTVSIFESQEQAEESNKVALGWIKENLAPYMQGPVDAVAGKVAVHGGT